MDGCIRGDMHQWHAQHTYASQNSYLLAHAPTIFDDVINRIYIVSEKKMRKQVAEGFWPPPLILVETPPQSKGNQLIITQF